MKIGTIQPPESNYNYVQEVINTNAYALINKLVTLSDQLSFEIDGLNVKMALG